MTITLADDVIEKVVRGIMDNFPEASSGCELDLQKLLDAPDGDFGHDVFGIRRHINRQTGELGDCFLPRCAVN